MPTPGLFHSAKKMANGALAGRSIVAQPVGNQRRRKRSRRRGCEGISGTFLYNGQSTGDNGSPQYYTVPAGVTQLAVQLWGAQGGTTITDVGGRGAYMRALITVVPGEILQINVGGQPLGGRSGSNGGGRGNSASGADGYGGGGATDIRRSPYGLTDRLAVAGAGGGATTNAAPRNGGLGGYPNGEDGNAGGVPNNGEGDGGTQAAGGAAGLGSFPLGPATSGTLGLGGAGTGGPFLGSAGAGGGAGLYGGGGGGQAGPGGGGSSGTTGQLVAALSGVREGHGLAILADNCAGEGSSYEPTLLTSGTTTNTDPIVTASVTVARDSLILAAYVHTRDDSVDPAAPVSINGFGLAWTQIATSLFDTTSITRARLTLYRAMPVSALTDTVTIDVPSAPGRHSWAVLQFSGLVAGADGANAIVQTVVATGLSSSPVATLAAFETFANPTLGVCASSAVTGGVLPFPFFTPGSGFAELVDEGSDGAPQNHLAVEHAAVALTTVNGTINDASSGAQPWAMVGLELRSI